jgi:hypothetical protein
MKLLSPEDTKDKAKVADVEAKARAGKLRTQETILAKGISDAREVLASEQDRITKAIASGIKDLSCFEQIIIVTKRELEREVKDLEARRDAAKRPVDERIAEIVSRETIVRGGANEIIEQRQELEMLWKEINKMDDAFSIRRTELDTRETKLNKASDILTSKIEVIVKNGIDLAEKQAEFERWSTEKKLEIKQMGIMVGNMAKANDIVRQEIVKERQAIANDRLAVKDGYESLARAQEEILRNKKK